MCDYVKMLATFGISYNAAPDAQIYERRRKVWNWIQQNENEKDSLEYFIDI